MIEDSSIFFIDVWSDVFDLVWFFVFVSSVESRVVFQGNTEFFF